jgi:hypothetical protein
MYSYSNNEGSVTGEDFKSVVGVGWYIMRNSSQ